MAEAPPTGVLWYAAARAAQHAERDGGRLVVHLDPHGPAGVCGVELPDGAVVHLDHLDPGRLVALDVPTDDAAASPLLVALFGGDGALALADAHGARPAGADGVAARGAVPLDVAGERFGRLVLLADLATDPAVAPLARIAAAAEFAADHPATPGGEVLAPLLSTLVAAAVAAATDIVDADLGELDPKLRHRLAAAVRRLARTADPAAAEALTGLAARLLAARDRHDDIGIVAASLLATEAPHEEEPPEGTAPLVVLRRRSPSVLEVRTRSAPGRWARALRRDGLVTVALAPLSPHGRGARAELLVPPDTPTDALTVHLVEAPGLGAVAGAPLDLVRRAVRVGRAAASADRLGRRHAAAARWRRCSELWAAAGDTVRADEAAMRTGQRGGRPVAGAVLADELDPYAEDDELELVDP